MLLSGLMKVSQPKAQMIMTKVM